MRLRFWVFLLGVFLFIGCGESGSPTGAAGQVAPLPPVTADLRVILDLSPVAPVGPQVPFPDSAARFQIELENPVQGGLLAGPVTLDRLPGQTRLEQLFPGLPIGPLRLLVTTLDARGARLGLSDQVLSLASPRGEVTVSTLFMPGPTREIGLISIGQQGVNGPSRQPALSSDGRFVAFSSSATNLLSTLTTGAENRIYVRDRLTAQIRLASLLSTSPTTSTITDGSSNTLVFAESGSTTSTPSDGSSNTLTFSETSPITDGTSNTLFFAEACASTTW